jgi:ketosteroid isomerase-like protein
MNRRTALKSGGLLLGTVASAAAAGSAVRACASDRSQENLKVVNSYLAAWRNKDLKGIGEHLHPDVRFIAPSAMATGKGPFLAAAERVFRLLRSLEVQATFASGDQAVAIYDFKCVEPIGNCPTAELLTLRDGQITQTQLFFDPRPFDKLAKPKK